MKNPDDEYMERPDFSFLAKWGEEIAARGFTAVPNALLEHAKKLDLKPMEFLVIVNIDSFRWDAHSDPYPSVETLAKRIGVNPKTVIRTVTSLEKKGYICRIKRRNTSNKYNLSPLKIKLLKYVRITNTISRKGHLAASGRDKRKHLDRTPLSPKEYSKKNTKEKELKILKYGTRSGRVSRISESWTPP